MARLPSVNVGLPRDIQWKGRTVHTAIWKYPVPGRCHVGRLNLDGDGQGDLAGHGGEHRAVFVYQIESYRYWEEQLKKSDFVHGQFGESGLVSGAVVYEPARLTCLRQAMFLYVAHNRLASSSSICEAPMRRVAQPAVSGIRESAESNRILTGK